MPRILSAKSCSTLGLVRLAIAERLFSEVMLPLLVAAIVTAPAALSVFVGSMAVPAVLLLSIRATASEFTRLPESAKPIA